jgi:aryl-alcohol dehydrogenase-like predicted oxidoreductase
MTPATTSETFRIGGDMPVRRMGFGAMQLTGDGVWGPMVDQERGRLVLRRAVELGVTFIDTADVYGPGDNERLIRSSLAPYPSDLVIGTKAGLVRSGPATRENPGISMDGSEAHIRRAVEGSLRDLGVDRIDLLQLHRVDPATPLEETLGVLKSLRGEGKIRHIGLSEVDVPEIERAQAIVEIATVQNIFNLAVRRRADVMHWCEAHGVAFIPFWPLHIETVAETETLKRVSEETGATPRQVALAWLLQRSSTTIVIPGTSSLAHLDENLGASALHLTDVQMEDLEKLGQT